MVIFNSYVSLPEGMTGKGLQHGSTGGKFTRMVIFSGKTVGNMMGKNGNRMGI
jgi:hypothetical protein